MFGRRSSLGAGVLVALFAVIVAVVPAVALASIGSDTTFSINGGAAFTGSHVVALDSQGTDIVEMRFCDGPYWTGESPCNSTEWRPFAQRTAWTLPPGVTNAVTAQYRDAAGTIVQRTDDINVDDWQPWVGIVPTSGEVIHTLWFAAAVDVACTGSDTDSGVASIACTVNGEPASDASFAPSVPTATVTFTLPAPADHTGDGSKLVMCTVTDLVGNAATEISSLGIDTWGPVIGFTGAEALWRREPVTIHFRGDDQMADGVGCSGLAYQRGRLDGGDWMEGDTLTVPAPLDHSNDGLHVVEAMAEDWVGNQGPIGVASVRIDTLGPVTSAPSPVTVKQGATTGVLPFRVDDACPSANVRIVVVAGRKRPTVYATLDVGRCPTGQSLTAGLPASLPRGSYTFTVYASDLAGNPQAVAGSNSLRVK